VTLGRRTSPTKESLPTAEARRRLPSLVKTMAEKTTPSANLLDDAIDIGPHRKGGAVLLPEIDAAAHEQEARRLRARVDELEDDLEDLGLLLFIEQRLTETAGRRLSAAEFLSGIGMEEFVDQIPRT
jgi:hypothetical protein